MDLMVDMVVIPTSCILDSLVDVLGISNQRIRIFIREAVLHTHELSLPHKTTLHLKEALLVGEDFLVEVEEVHPTAAP